MPKQADILYDLSIFSEMIIQMGGLAFLSDLSEGQLECLSGGKILKAESISISQSQSIQLNVKKTSKRLFLSCISCVPLFLFWISLATLSNRLLFNPAPSLPDSSPSIIIFHVKPLSSAVDFVTFHAIIYLFYLLDLLIVLVQLAVPSIFRVCVLKHTRIIGRKSRESGVEANLSAHLHRSYSRLWAASAICICYFEAISPG